MNSFGIYCLNPTLICGLIDVVLTKKEARDFKSCVPDLISEHHELYNALLKKLDDGVRELCSDSSIEMVGWADGSTAREPVSITHQVQDAQLFIEKNQILTAENILYRSCLALKEDDSLAADDRGYLQMKDGLTSWENTPLFFWHEEPLPSWYEPASPSQNSNPTEIPAKDTTKKVTELSRRDLRKQETQKAHGQWRAAYVELKQQHPDKFDTWIADKISKMDIAIRNGKPVSAGAIRRIMKEKVER